LTVRYPGKEPVLRGVSLDIGRGEIVGLVGQSGSGKSTLAHVLMGRPGYEILDGSVTLDGIDLLALPTWQRARAGLFLGMQHPIEVPGVSLGKSLTAARPLVPANEIGSGDGDIGAHFPPADPRWRGAASSIFLADAAARARARGGIVAHLDATLVCEAPKIGPHREAMRARIAEIAGVALDRVAVKATTSEGLGFAGRREGIACLAVATVRLPSR